MQKIEKNIINKYLGIPYKHRGRTMQALDCWGLLKFAYADLGFNLFDVEDYEKTWSQKGKNYFKENYINDWIKVDEPQVLDAVLFLNSKGIANHAGIVLSDRKFIHACRQGVIISKLDDKSWKTKIEGFYRLKDKK